MVYHLAEKVEVNYHSRNVHFPSHCFQRLTQQALLITTKKGSYQILFVYRNVMDGREGRKRVQNVAVELEDPKDLGDSVQERGKEHTWLYNRSWQAGARITSCLQGVGPAGARDQAQGVRQSARRTRDKDANRTIYRVKHQSS